MQNTISYLKFPEEFESLIRIKLRVESLALKLMKLEKISEKNNLSYAFLYAQQFFGKVLTLSLILINDRIPRKILHGI